MSPERPADPENESREGATPPLGLSTSSKYWIDFHGNSIELRGGQLLVGRSAMCRLVLDDPLVSRQHAEFRLVDDQVWVFDLKSVNGVFVNGQRVDKAQPLRPGDRIVIGEQELALVARIFDVETTPHIPARRRLADTLAGSADSLGAELGSVRPGMIEETVNDGDALDLLGGVADKVLALGRGEEAERILSTYLTNLLEQAKTQGQVMSRSADRAAAFAVKLGQVMGKGSWIDYAFALFSALRRPLPGPVVDELFEVLRRVNGVNVAAIQKYVAILRAEQNRFGPAERFLVQRIEGLERLAALR